MVRRRKAIKKLKVHEHVTRIDDAEHDLNRHHQPTLDGKADGGHHVVRLGKQFEGGGPLLPGAGVIIAGKPQGEKPVKGVKKKRKKKKADPPKKKKKQKDAKPPPPPPPPAPATPRPRARREGVRQRPPPPEPTEPQGGDLYREVRGGLSAPAAQPPTPQAVTPQRGPLPQPLLPVPSDPISGRGDPDESPLLDQGRYSPATLSDPPSAEGDSDAGVEGDVSYKRSGSCRQMTRREACCLLGVILLGAAVVAVSLILSSQRDAIQPEEEPSISPGVPGKVVSNIATYTTKAAVPQEILMKTLREEGLSITLTKSGGEFNTSGMVVGSPDSFASKVILYSNVSDSDQDGGFAANIPRFYAELGVFLKVGPREIVIALKNGTSVSGGITEGVKVYLKGEGAEGIPVEFALKGEAQELPKSAQKKITDEGSKATAAASVFSTTATIGTAASVGALPRLHLIASVFDCPSDSYFEVDWVTHPLSLLGFPDIDIGDYPPLAKHISAMVGGFTLLGATALCMVAISAVLRCTKSLSWGEAFATLGFPHYLVAVYAFICPGISVCSMQTVFYHPDAMAQVFAMGTFILLCVVPLLYISAVLFTKYFNAFITDSEDERRLSQFLLGKQEWSSNDETFIGRYSLFFQDYGVQAKWFILLELGVSIAFGVIESAKPDTREGCMWRSWALLFANTVHLCAMCFLTPLLAMFELLYAGLLSFLQEALLFFVVINQHEDDRNHWSGEVAATFAIISLWAIRVKCGLDIAVLLYEYCINRGSDGFIKDDDDASEDDAESIDRGFPDEDETTNDATLRMLDLVPIEATPAADYTPMKSKGFQELTIVVAGRAFSTHHPGVSVPTGSRRPREMPLQMPVSVAPSPTADRGGGLLQQHSFALSSTNGSNYSQPEWASPLQSSLYSTAGGYNIAAVV